MSVLQKRVTLDCAPVIAFEVFTYDMAKWWPMESHSISAGNATLPANLIVERKEDGRIIEIDSNGKAHLWGHFQIYQAPFRVLIAWHVNEPSDRSTYIEVVFGMETNGKTIAVLTHGGWDVFQDDADQKRADYDAGWDFVFGDCYKYACQQAAKDPAPIFEPKINALKSRKKSGRAANGSVLDAVHLVH
ncbi:MAG: hypothetical protein KAS85_11395 [Rhodobacteraceae bacterium]|nr:hypothetical protein [Paracoccaceae bacterium]